VPKHPANESKLPPGDRRQSNCNLP
jgi:hypothetical protein